MPNITPDLDYFLSSLTEETLNISGNSSTTQSELFNDNVFPKLTKRKKEIKKIEKALEDHLKDIQKILGIPNLAYKTVTNQEVSNFHN